MSKINFEMVAKSLTKENDKKRYIEGITSGVEKDGQGERMTENAVNSFHNQAMKGDILLYEGKHGVNFIDDIGILTKSFIDSTGDWHTEYRLYEEEDNVGDGTMEKVNKVWMQINGLPPYNSPREFGFSIEGVIPEGGVLYADNEGKRRVMNDVTLDGVVLVPRPAYQKSIASAVQKALDSYPEVVTKEETTLKIERSFGEKLKLRKSSDEYMRKSLLIQDLFDESIQELAKDSQNRDAKLDELLEQYKEELKQNIIGSWDVLEESHLFQDAPDYSELETIYAQKENKNKLKEVNKQIAKEFVNLLNIIEGGK